MQEESIYNLIPKEIVTPPKQKLYRSRFYHSIPPTGSTFGHHTTSVPKVNKISLAFCVLILHRSQILTAATKNSKAVMPINQPEQALASPEVK